MFCMTENEKLEQIGRAAEEYSHLKGRLNHVNEKLTQAQAAYQFLGQIQNFQNLRVQDGRLVNPAQYGAPPQSLEGLLNTCELVEVLTEQQRLSAELANSGTRLKALAPHLL